MHATIRKVFSILTQLSLITTLNSPNVWALDLTPDETKKTIEMLQACDKALGAARAESEVDGRIKAKQSELIKLQDERLLQLNKDTNSIVNSPAFWFVTGMLVTGLTVRLVK